MTSTVADYNAMFPELLKNHAAAIDLNLTLYGICEVWDDLIDGDPASHKQINNAFFDAMVNVPRNPFYREHFPLLSPLIESAILDWYAANELEKRGDIASLRESYILRCGFHRVTVMSAKIIGGLDWANEVNIRLHSEGETFDEYAAKFGVK